MDSRTLLGILLLFTVAAPAAYGVDTLYDARFKQWTEQAQKGDPDAQYNLGNAYLRGTEVARDFDAAASWFEKAAEQDHVKALYKLGYLYLEGKGLKRDYGKAYKYLRRSAQHEYSPAQFYLGELYADGNGVAQDNNKALYWLSQAADDNYVPAKAEVSRIKELIAAEAAAEKARAARDAAAKEAAAREAAAKAAENRPKPKPVVKVESKPAAAVVAKAEPTPKPAPRHKPEPVAVAKPKPEQAAEIDTKALLLTGNWLNAGGEPSKHMPSARTKCSIEGNSVVCETERLKRTNVFARIDYMVKAKFGRFSDDGQFMGTYRTNVLYVRPDDPDNTSHSEADVPKLGWKQQTIIKCKFTGKDRLDCVNDNFKREHFTRAEAG